MEVHERRHSQKKLRRASAEACGLLPGLPVIVTGLLLRSKDRNKPQLRANQFVILDLDTLGLVLHVYAHAFFAVFTLAASTSLTLLPVTPHLSHYLFPA